jgi:hypothetical protein
MVFVDYFKGVGVILKYTFIFIFVPILVYAGIMFTIYILREKFPKLFERTGKIHDLLIEKIVPFSILAVFLFYYWGLDGLNW